MSRLKVNEIIPFSGDGVGIGGAPTDDSALLELISTTQGFLYPRMTTAQRDAISSPADGLTIYNTDTKSIDTYNGTAWESGGIKSINGMTGKNQVLNTGASGTAPNWTQSGGNTNTLNIPLASTAAVTAGLISKGEYDYFNQKLNPVKNVLRVVKNAVLGTGDFGSLEAALASISDASITNPYLISVGPGVFQENQIQMKEYVWVEGAEQDQTVLEAINPNAHFILGIQNSGISKSLISGATGSGYAGVFFQGTTSTDKDSFFVEDCRFGANDTHVIADGSIAPSAVFIEEGRFGGNYQFTTGFVAQAGGRIVMRNSTTTSVSTPVPDDVFYAEGSGSEIVLNGVQLRNGNAAAGNCVRLRDGARLRALSFNIKNWAKGIFVENVGAAPFIDVVGVLTEGNTIDLQVDHPTADGTFSGSANHNKIIISPTAPLSVVITCNAVPSDNTGSVTVGDMLQGDRYDRLANLSRLARESAIVGVVDGGDIDIASGLDISIDAGYGFLLDNVDDYLIQVNWDADAAFTLPANSDVYIVVDKTGTITTVSSLSYPVETVILLGRAVTGASSVLFLEESLASMKHLSNKFEAFFREALGPIYSSGSIVTENTTRKLDITNGKYNFGSKAFAPQGGTAVQFIQHYKNGSGGWTTSSLDTVNNANYDNGSGTLASLTASYYAKHALYVVGEGSETTYLLVLAQAQYSSLILVEAADLPAPPTYVREGVTLIASITVQQGATNIVQIRDERPTIGFKASSVSASADHGNLLGLLDDDHPQYFKTDGTRVATGAFNMGGNDITNVGNVDGVDISGHAARHLPNGADPITTAAPAANLSATTTNATGTANSLSRSDHSHAINTGAASSQVPDQANATGSSANLARADHTHNIPTAAPAANLSATTTNSQGVAASFSRSDHAHAISTAAASTQTPDQANAAGSSANLARADHVHTIPTAAPSNTGTANAQGSAASFARSDHVHNTVIANTQLTETADYNVNGAAVITGMTVTPAAGTYFVTFSSSVLLNASGEGLDYGLYVGGVLRTHTQRSSAAADSFGTPTDEQSLHTQGIFTVNGSQAIDARVISETGTATIHQRSLILIRLGP